MIDFGAARNESLWHAEPTLRGTYSIISECMVTLVLCVWTAVHLNIPEHGKSGAQSRRKILWILVGIFVPELVVWIAWDQNREARALHSEVKRALGQKEPLGVYGKVRERVRRVVEKIGMKSEGDLEKAVDDGHPSVAANPLRTHHWTMTHSFFAAMGGFVFDADALRHKALPGGRKRATLSSPAIVRLATVAPHLLPDISVNVINDKSKSSKLAQTVVALQASWFLVQCISRMAMGLTISLLELNTLTHCLCALAAYLLWWDKPLDIQESMFIHGEDADLLCAGMFLKSTLGTKYVAEDFFDGQQITARLWHEEDGDLDPQFQEHGLLEYLATGIHTVPSRPTYTEIEPPEAGPGERELPWTLYMGQSLFGFGFRRCSPGGFYQGADYDNKGLLAAIHPSRSTGKAVESGGLLSLRRPFIRVNSGDVRWLRLAHHCYHKYPDVAYRQEDSVRKAEISYWQHPFAAHYDWLHEYVVPRSANWKITAGKPHLSMAGITGDTGFTIDRTSAAAILMLTIVGAIYGGLHLMAWNPPILAESERILWRASGIVIAVWFPVLTFLFLPLALVASSFADSRSSTAPRWTVKSVAVRPVLLLRVAAWLVWLILICGWLFAAAARLYIPIQSVVSIPRLPDSAFETPNWSQYFPHIS